MEKRATQLEKTTCWRVSVTLREFATPDPIDLFYRYPIHLTDANGELAKYKVEGEDPYLRNKEKRDREQAEKFKADQDEKNQLLKEAIDACAEEGIEPSRANILEVIGEYKGKAVTEGQVRDWTTPKKSPWSNFHCDAVKTRRGKTKYLVVENVSNQTETE